MKRQALVAPSTMKCHRRQQQQQQQHHWKASPTCSSESDPEIVRLKAVLGSTTTSQPKYRVGRVKKQNQRYYTDDFIVDPILEDCGDTTTTACGDTTTTVLHELKSWIGFRRAVVRRKRPRRVVPSLVMERHVMGMGGSDGGTNNEAAGNNVLTLGAGQVVMTRNMIQESEKDDHILCKVSEFESILESASILLDPVNGYMRRQDELCPSLVQDDELVILGPQTPEKIQKRKRTLCTTEPPPPLLPPSANVIGPSTGTQISLWKSIQVLSSPTQQSPDSNSVLVSAPTTSRPLVCADTFELVVDLNIPSPPKVGVAAAEEAQLLLPSAIDSIDDDEVKTMSSGFGKHSSQVMNDVVGGDDLSLMLRTTPNSAAAAAEQLAHENLASRSIPIHCTTSTVDPAAEDTCHTNVASSSPPPPVIDRSLHPQADNCKNKNKNKNKAWSSKTHTKWKFTIRDSTEIKVKVKVRKKKYTPKVWREKRPAKVPKVNKTNGDKPRTAHHVQVGGFGDSNTQEFTKTACMRRVRMVRQRSMKPRVIATITLSDSSEEVVTSMFDKTDNDDVCSMSATLLGVENVVRKKRSKKKQKMSSSSGCGGGDVTAITVTPPNGNAESFDLNEEPLIARLAHTEAQFEHVLVEPQNPSMEFANVEDSTELVETPTAERFNKKAELTGMSIEKKVEEIQSESPPRPLSILSTVATMEMSMELSIVATPTDESVGTGASPQNTLALLEPKTPSERVAMVDINNDESPVWASSVVKSKRSANRKQSNNLGHSVRRSLMQQFDSVAAAAPETTDLLQVNNHDAHDNTGEPRNLFVQPLLQQEPFSEACCPPDQNVGLNMGLYCSSSRLLSQPIPFLQMDSLQQVAYLRNLMNSEGYHRSHNTLRDDLLRKLPETKQKEVLALWPKVTKDADYDPYPRSRNHTKQRLLEDISSQALQMVPYEGVGSSQQIVEYKVYTRRKMKIKPKVVLDAETIQMWNRVMFIKGAKDETATEMDEEKWKKERSFWKIRADNFNCIMRQIQGDRTFSKWGGSVVDSVVGAFLTQNVTDYLSSSVFMSLRAHFPPSCVEEKSATRDEPNIAEHVEEPLDETTTEIVLTESGSPTSSLPIELSCNGHETRADESHIHHINADIIDQVKSDLHMQAYEEEAKSDESQIYIDVASTDHQVNSNLDSECEAGADEAHINYIKAVSVDPVEPNSENQQHLLGEKCLVPDAIDGSIISSMESLIETHSGRISDMAEKIDGCSTDFSKLKVEVRCIDNPEEASAARDNYTAMCIEASDPGVLNVEPVGFCESHASIPMFSGATEMIRKFPDLLDDKKSLMAAEGALAATLRTVLGKTATSRSSSAIDDLKPLEFRKMHHEARRRAANLRNARMAEKVQLRFLTGPERARFEESRNSSNKDSDNWQARRREILTKEGYLRDNFTKDCVDWEAVRLANVDEVARVIKDRGMNNVLAGRIKAFLERVHNDQKGSLDLEWIRHLAPDDAKRFLLGVRGLGLKSVECIRLLTLHHPSFPVDTNVGRIAVRLGWVPLEPLPEETQLHLLEMYPVQEHIQQYLWPRLCTLDQQTLYELHYQMITFGKVFCTKSKPNCNACPMRGECKHFASAFASAKPLLMGPETTSMSTALILPETMATTVQQQHDGSNYLTLLPPINAAGEGRVGGSCIPIIEEPSTPEQSCAEMVTDHPLPDIEDVLFREHIENLSAETASLFSKDEEGQLVVQITPKPILAVESDAFKAELLKLKADLDMDNDDVPMLIDTSLSLSQTITQNETTKPPSVIELDDGDIMIDELVESTTILQSSEDSNIIPSQELILLPPHACRLPAPELKNIHRLRTVHYVYELPDTHPLLMEMDRREVDDPCYYLLAIWSPGGFGGESETVKGTLLVPCRTAMKGCFPLNGTYFQVNEVFADHASSLQPIEVPRRLLWSLQRRFVYFGTAVTNIFKGYICVRAFNQRTREPQPLATRLHQSGKHLRGGSKPTH
ncbi:hypothetical protein CY35_05G078200 [Sphagnum magellanicum]|nr:hypothetical protein CY35_05G078200 [Sphagnum magellanicum]